ncbi:MULTISPECIES: type 2 periplasmic-binding domain-containing protein [Paenibacillus]|uniref:sugar ABC transporter substrate-binding protein n=1 Tax=Paenibacillus TaxID=44249 RepID=UPI0011A369A2|nr:sugar ABC transporter substrate-binding protein [Paenibacillus sp. IHBB 10380]
MGGKKKSVLRFSMTLLLSLGLVLSACGGGNKGAAKNDNNGQEAGENIANGVEPFEISVFIGQPDQQPTPDNKIYKLIKEKTGASFKFEFLAGDIDQKLGVMIAGGDYPDMMTANQKLTAAGAFIPLEDLIEEHAPNLKKHYEKYWNMMKDPNDGHIYNLPNYGVTNADVSSSWYSGPAFWIQKDVLAEAGYPEVKTLDQYFDLIKQYKEKHPTIDGTPTIGFEILNYDWKNWGLFNAPQHLIGHPNDGGVVVKDGKAEIFADKDYAKRYYKKLNEMNALGIIDKETFTQNFDQYMAKISSGAVLGMFDQHWNFQSAENALITQKKDERTYVGLPLVFDEGIRDHYKDRPALNLNNGFGITVNASEEQAIRIIKLLDTLIQEDWQKILAWGIEGEDYIVKDGRFMKTQEQRDLFTDATWKLANKADSFYGQAPKMEGLFSDGNATDAAAQPEEILAGMKEYDKNFLAQYGFNSYVDFFSPAPENDIAYPAWSVDLVDGSEAKIVNTKQNELSTKYLPKAILAKPEEFDSVWDEYVKEIRNLNIKAYEDRINEVLQWRRDTWSVK